MLLSVDGSGTARLVPQYNFSDQRTVVDSVELLEFSYAVHAGLNYPGTIHGSYSSSLILAQEGMAENTTTGSANSWYGLYVTIRGNGQVLVYSQSLL